MQFFNSLIIALSSDIANTLMMCCLSALCVALVMRFIVKGALKALDEYVENNVEPSNRLYGIYYTVKAFLYSGIAFALTVFAMSRIFAVCIFPLANAKELFFLYCIPVYALQWVLDKYMKPLAEKWFGIKIEIDEEGNVVKPEKAEKPAKPKKVKVHTKKVKYTVDENGNEIVIG